MNNIIRFMENEIVINWVCPLIIAALAGGWGMFIKTVKERRIGMPYRVYNRKSVYLLEKYCERNRVHPIVSYGDTNALNLYTEIDKGRVTVRAEVDLQKKPQSNDNRHFVMIMLKYIPKCNMTYFYNKGYSFMFDAKSEKGICGIQVEVKDTHKLKVIDEFVEIEKEWKSYAFKLNEYGLSEAWKEIEEICFTIFLEKEYILKNKAYIEIRNCILQVEK